MSNESMNAPGSPESRDDFLRFAYNLSSEGGMNETPGMYGYIDDDIPTDADLMPDEEYYRDYRDPGPKKPYEYDVAIIGGGPAGYAAAMRAARLGADVILFEKDMLGGLSLNAGCVPAKTYLKSAEILKTVNTADYYGVTGAGSAGIDLRKTLQYKDNIVAKLTSNIARMLRSCRVRVEAGEARLQSAHEVHCRGRNYSTAKVILCCGTKAGLPDIPGLNLSGVCSTNELFSLTSVPSRMLVLGGGGAGCEIASAFAAFGSNVMLVEPNTRILPDMDAQVAEAIEKALTDAGAKIHAGIAVREVTDRDGCPFVITERGGVLCDKVVVTSDRQADTSFLGSLANAIAFRNGAVLVNEYLETSVPGIFAAGDITGLGSKTHAAYLMAECAASNALGGKRPIDLRVVPSIVYTSPQAASVGLSEGEARDKYGGELLIGYCPLSENARAMFSGTTEGFVKVLAGKRFGEIYGVHIVGAEAAEMIAEPAALMRMEVTVHEAAGDIVHAHPSYAEAFMEACADALGRSIHLMNAEMQLEVR